MRRVFSVDICKLESGLIAKAPMVADPKSFGELIEKSKKITRAGSELLEDDF